MTFGMYGLFMLTSLMFQQERGASALGAGLSMLPLAVAATALSPLTGRPVTRHGPRLPMTAGVRGRVRGGGGRVSVCGRSAAASVTEYATACNESSESRKSVRSPTQQRAVRFSSSTVATSGASRGSALAASNASCSATSWVGRASASSASPAAVTFV